MSREYNTTGVSDLIDESNDGNGFFGAVGNVIGTFWNDITGQTKQQKEFEQQEYLMDKENAYNDPRAQMARLRAAGINPNSAASEIAGQNVSASPAQVSSSGDVASALGTLGGLAALPSQIGLNSANAFKAVEEGQTVAEMAYAQQLEIQSKIGVNDATAKSIIAETKWIDKKALASLSLTEAQIAETTELVNVHKEQVNLMKEQAAAARAAGKLDEALALTQGYITEQEKFRSGLIEKFGWDPYAATDNAIMQMVLSGDWDSYNSFMDYLYDKQYSADEASYEWNSTFADEELERDATRLANDIAKQWNIPSSSIPGLIEQISNFRGKNYGRTHSNDVRHIQYDVTGREYHKPKGRKGGAKN